VFVDFAKVLSATMNLTSVLAVVGFVVPAPDGRLPQTSWSRSTAAMMNLLAAAAVVGRWWRPSSNGGWFTGGPLGLGSGWPDREPVLPVLFFAKS
jgi:hypothetical protein